MALFWFLIVSKITFSWDAGRKMPQYIRRTNNKNRSTQRQLTSSPLSCQSSHRQ